MARKISAPLDMDGSATPWPPQAGMSLLRGGHYLRKVWFRFQSSGVTCVILENILTRSEKPCEATETGNIEEVIVITCDITERKRAEGELMKHREHVEELVNKHTTEWRAANQQLQEEMTEGKRAELAVQEAVNMLRVL